MSIKLNNSTSVVDVANYFVYLDCNDTNQNRIRITPLKLQKLLYYAQSFSLSATKEVLFNDEIVAWDYGPVVKRIYHEFRYFGSNPIDLEDCDLKFELDKKQRTIIEGVFNIFKHKSGSDLVQSTHKEQPWLSAYKSENETISKEIIYAYFRKVMA
jgi:uncharacterized phage-associated protein